jgi:transposase-like protein
MPVPLNSYNLAAAEKALCVAALEQGGSIVEAARMLGITRHALKRRIVKHAIDWPRSGASVSAPTTEQAADSQLADRHSEPAAPAPRFF